MKNKPIEYVITQHINICGKKEYGILWIDTGQHSIAWSDSEHAKNAAERILSNRKTQQKAKP